MPLHHQPNKLCDFSGLSPMNGRERPLTYLGHLWCEVILREPHPASIKPETSMRWQSIGRKVVLTGGAVALAISGTVISLVKHEIADMEPVPCKTFTAEQLADDAYAATNALYAASWPRERTRQDWYDELLKGSVEICGQGNINDVQGIADIHTAGIDSNIPTTWPTITITTTTSTLATTTSQPG